MKALRFFEPRHGWMEIAFLSDHEDYRIVVSHAANDCVRDFVQAMIRILSGSLAEEVHFFLEPDFAICRLRRDKSDICISIQIPRDDQPPYEQTFPMIAFAKRLVFECNRIRPFCKVAGAWNAEYPLREIECLLAFLENAPPAGQSAEIHSTRSK